MKIRKADDFRLTDAFVDLWTRFTDKLGWNGSIIKLIALVSMTIDHVGAAIIEYMMDNATDMSEYSRLSDIDHIMRSIGRVAFPLFCFMLVQGFVHTSSRKKYLLRLAVFAVICEIPFDLAFFHKVFYWDHQNVFLTFTIGLLMMICLDKVSGVSIFRKAEWLNMVARVVFDFCIFLGFGTLSYMVNCDYSVNGIIIIFLFYALRNVRFGSMIAGLASGWIVLDEIPALGALLPIAMYNGRKGFKLKWFFYIYYPAHILILYVVAKFMGIA